MLPNVFAQYQESRFKTCCSGGREALECLIRRVRLGVAVAAVQVLWHIRSKIPPLSRDPIVSRTSRGFTYSMFQSGFF